MIKEGILPDQLMVHGVEKLGDFAVAWGGYADIWKGTFKGELVALKVLRLYGQPEDQKALLSVCFCLSFRISLSHWIQEFCKEALVWRLLQHENLCPFYGVCVDVVKPHHAFVAPWMPNGALLGYLKERLDVDRTNMVSRSQAYIRRINQYDIARRNCHGTLLSAFLPSENNSWRS